MEYNKTINLPKTKFKMKANLHQLEPRIQKKWDDMKLYELMMENTKDKPRFILHDGPPYANGHIHLGHALNKILKDIVVKFKTVQGYNTPYIPGWDCHGLPIEFQLLKDLGLTRHEIDQVKLRKKAAKYALKFVDIQRKEFKTLGLVGDWERPYLTLDPLYEVRILEVFKTLVEKGFIYRKKKPVYWCSVCETALAEAEVEYLDHSSPSVYVKFRVEDSSGKLPDGASILIWTTTPWTLPANVALAFHPKYEYSVVDTDKGVLVMAKGLLDSVIGKLGLKKNKEIKTVKGSELEGIKCRHPLVDRVSVGVCADYITLEDGTGVVHTAPGHGLEDYATGVKYNLPVLSPVDNKGNFTGEFKEFEGRNVFKSNTGIIQKLLDSGDLLFTVKITHSYPHCWRCKAPVIFRATYQWFMNINMNNLRQELLDKIKEVKWSPEAGENRISGMVESRPDWCLSRQRNWGVPIPVFYCRKCAAPLMTVESISAFQKIVEKEGTDSWFMKAPEEILGDIKCSKCGGSEFNRGNDILDVWFESGSSYESVVKHRRELNFPADLYLEGSDQHRGWFQASLINAVAADGVSPFRQVLTHGFIVDAQGKKMSKSIGNVISPQDIMKKFGADILRLWVSSVDYSEDIRISEEIIGHIVDSYRRFRNTFKFLLGNLHEFDKSKKVDYRDMPEIDRYILHELNSTISQVIKHYDNYEFHRVYRILHDFCAVKLSSFYFDCLKDRLYTFPKDSELRRSAQTVLREITTALSLLVSPVLSYTAEEVWELFTSRDSGKESIFLMGLPDTREEYRDDKLAAKWEKIIQLRGGVLRALELAREKGLLGNSLQAQVLLNVKDKELSSIINDSSINWNEVFIVSEVKACESEEAVRKCGINNLSEDVLTGIKKAPGEKCVRCWNYSVSVGGNSEHPELCERCVDSVKHYKDLL